MRELSYAEARRLVDTHTPGGARAHPDLKAAAWRGLERARATFRPDAHRGGLDGWVKRCIRGYVSNQRREWLTRAKIGEPVGDVDDVAPPSAPESDPFIRAAIERAFAALPPRQAEAAWMYFGEGATCDEMGAALGVTRQAASAFVARAQVRLQLALCHLRIERTK